RVLKLLLTERPLSVDLRGEQLADQIVPRPSPAVIEQTREVGVDLLGRLRAHGQSRRGREIPSRAEIEPELASPRVRELAPAHVPVARVHDRVLPVHYPGVVGR